MTLQSRLARELLRLDPVRAAAALEELDLAEAARLLGAIGAEEAAPLLAAIAPHAAAAVLERLPAPGAAAMLERLEQDTAARLVRRLAEVHREAILAHLPPAPARALTTLLHFPEHTAGALMDPGVLALPRDITVDEARRRVRDASNHARYNVYVVDRNHVLVGVVNLRELLVAAPHATLADVMTPDPQRLVAHADRAAVVAHPGWKHVHSIPVVDERGCYLGAVRYRTLRQLEEELLGAAEADADASRALGELFAAGAAGLLDALADAGSRRST
jgi:magnesium transporter